MRRPLQSKASSPQLLLGLQLLLLLSPSACSRPDSSAPSPSASPAAPALADGELQQALAQLHATLGLLHRVHMDNPPGADTPQQPAAPTKELLLAHAHGLFARVAPALLVQHPGAHGILARVLKQLPADLKPEHPPQAGRTILADALRGLDRLVEQKTAARIRGAREAVAAADALLVTEAIVGDYRLGIATTPPQTQYLPVTTGQLEVKPSIGTTHYLIITVRERLSKRHLPRAAVSVRVAEQGMAISLVESWGAFMHYGANLVFKPGQKLRLQVSAGPVNYKRYEALRGAFTKPVAWTVEATAEPGGALRLDAPPNRVTQASAPIGDDVLQAYGKVDSTEEAGPYRLGLISGSARPIWRLTAEGTEPVLQGEGSEHQLEVILFDRVTGRSITGARIALLLAAANQSPPRRLRLHPVMGPFHRYASSLTVPAGSYSVQAEIQAPSFATLTPQRFPHRQLIELSRPWRVAPTVAPNAGAGADARLAPSKPSPAGP